ncbi:hypothetical protein SSBR45G_11930 [Bradyrhizobium sp. SSBR45G]|uniref:hypothetical protein n=1 Tax=unclassified Bradyrhizobium TaxID=2631580 RepID=UPI0023429F0E|nr:MULTISPECIES: hypothetical protein [unclassified Bradyrhizobium]GLH76285.1 hypothetical protein SSBR45G_11930 [Bradyrhizobium sp. SSBR45G]GLH83232.1 hypothetical protein SSBR45R_06920 [Bradyrhizobium sp. SSBR45R]
MQVFEEPSASQYSPIFDIHPTTGMHFEVFYFGRSETAAKDFGGWFWWPRRRGQPPEGAATGAFPTSYAAYRDAMIGSGVHHRVERNAQAAVGA